MKIRNLGLVVGIATLASWGTGCEQGKIDCRALHYEFVAKYTLVSGGPECSGVYGEFMGVQSYFAASADKKTVDLNRSLLAIRTTEMAALSHEAADFGDETTVTKEVLDAQGDFAATEPDDGDQCSVPAMTPVEISVNAIPANEGDPADPDDDYPGRAATTIKHEWKNLRLLVSPANPGNFFKADLTYTVNNCTATYSVVGMAPVIGCIDPNGMPNDALCDDKADPEFGFPYGSGISRDLVPKCDTTLGVCLPTATSILP